MRTFTEDDAPAADAEVTPETVGSDQDNAQAEAPSESPDNGSTPEPVAETSTPKLTPAVARQTAETAWNAAVSRILAGPQTVTTADDGTEETVDNGPEPDPAAMAATLGAVPTAGRFLKELFGGVMGELAGDPDAFEKLSAVALYKNAVAELLEVTPERSTTGASASPEAIRSALVERWARASYVNECLTALGDVETLTEPENLTDDEKKSIADFSPTKVLVEALDKVKDALTGAGRKSGGSGSGSGHKSEEGDYNVPGNRFEHRGRDGKVTATLVINADKSQTLTRATGETIQYPAGTAASKSATDEAGNSNRNGLLHWALVKEAEG